MQHTHMHNQHLPGSDSEATQQTGAWLSIVGLVAWLAAMALAVAGPLLNIQIPAAVIVGMVVFSGVFSLLSLPRLLQSGDDEKH